MNFTEVILVDEQNEQLGTMEKMEAHQKGLLHRAFSIFIFNNNGQMLLHRRALAKYHSPGLWTNACCSHPFPGETTLNAATRRLKEEMGFQCPIDETGSFIYHATFENGLTEHEFDHLFIGTFNGDIFPNEEEVCGYKWLSIHEIDELLESSASEFTVWFKIAYPKIKESLTSLS